MTRARLIGQRLEHGPSGVTGLVIDDWAGIDRVRWVRLETGKPWEHFACQVDECRPARLRPYCIWTNPNKQAVEMTA